jgi:hypothetical protein
MSLRRRVHNSSKRLKKRETAVQSAKEKQRRKVLSKNRKTAIKREMKVL